MTIFRMKDGKIVPEMVYRKGSLSRTRLSLPRRLDPRLHGDDDQFGAGFRSFSSSQPRITR